MATKKKLIKKLVDKVLKIFGMPTYTEVRDEMRWMFAKRIERGEAWIGDDAERYDGIQRILRRSL